MIEIKLKGLDELMKSLNPQTISRAASLAINEAAKQARTEASSSIREKFNLPAARVNAEVRNVSLSTTRNLTAIIRAQGRPIGLTAFGAKWTRNVGGKARTSTATTSSVGKRQAKATGVTARIQKGTMTRLPNAFIARGRRGKVDGAGAMQVFQRKDLSRWDSPLINRAVITIASMMGNQRVLERMIKRASEVLDRRFAHHIERLMKK